jgi:ubiquinone/menaquinone biosynthesis C-methylase UbiE
MDLQPDQRASLWDHHVSAYETVFEPLTSTFAEAAIDQLQLVANERVIDVGAGCGGAGLIMARRGAKVLAIDASCAMARRAKARLDSVATCGAPAGHVAVMDGARLAVASATMDAALSVFGVVLIADAPAAVGEIARVLRPGGRAALVTWTEPENYELMAELMGAVRRIIPDFPAPPAPPAQLRYCEEAAFRVLIEGAGLRQVSIRRTEAMLQVPSAPWLADRIAFAPGMAALVSRLGSRGKAVLGAFVDRLEMSRGPGPFGLRAVALIGVGQKL